MGEFVFPASPSWYCSRVSDCTPEGLFLFGGRSSVYILDVSQSPPKYAGTFVAHSERVTGLSCGGSAGGRRVATAGEDGRVRVWDYSTLPPSLVDEHGNHKNKPTTIHWSSADDDVIVSGDEKGTVVVWHMSRGDVVQFALEKSAVFCLQCSPHNRFHVAVGYKSGLILIVDISGHGVIMQKLRGHDDEIHSVAWYPILGEDIRQRNDDEDGEEDNPFGEGCLLASGSRDRTLRLWSTSRGRCILNQKVPSVAARRERYDDQKMRVWLALMWVTDRPHTIITTSQTGDLLMWDLRRPGKQKFDVLTPNAPTRGHQRIVFNLSSPSGTSTDKLLSISMDRQILVWDLETLDVCVVPTLGGFPYCLSQSPVNPGRLAVGVGDNMIRVWNTVNPNNPYDCATYWQGLKSKVTTVCWHPNHEGWLAYGTDDGRVGIYDVLSPKAPKISSTYHRKTVYVVTWGPVVEASDDDAALVVYSCGDGNILLHDPSQLFDDAKNLRDFLTPSQPRSVQRSEVSWKHDFSALALGNEDGSIEIYTFPGLRLACALHVHHNCLNVIRWHPPFTTEGGPSPYCQNWIATGSNDSTVHVFNLDQYLGGGETSTPPLVTASLISLEGHTNRITGLVWSPHTDGLLASASYDGTAQVWKLLPVVTPLANFRQHSGRLFSIAWSSEDHDVIYSGGDDFCLFTWHISAQKHTTPPIVSEKKWNKKSKGKAKKARASPVANTTTKKPTADTLTPEKPTKEKPIAEKLAPDENLPGLTNSQVSELQALLNEKRRELNSLADETGAASVCADGDAHAHMESWTVPRDCATEPKPQKAQVKKEAREGKKKRAKSMFPVFSTAENRRKELHHEDCTELATALYRPEDLAESAQGASGHLAMYMLGRRQMYDLVQRENAHHQEVGNQDQLVLLDVWAGDVTALLETAATKGQLNDWLMAMAPSVSPAKWRHLCGVYADQLVREGHVTKAASFLLNAGKTHEAVSLLCQHKLFKEAVSLARLRLSPHDPLLEELYVAWAQHLTEETHYDGSLEQAAKCYLAAGHPLEAAQALSRRSNLSALRAAVDITRLANEEMAFRAYACKYITECQLRADWLPAYDVIAMDPYFKSQAVLVLTHEVLVRQLTELGLYNGHHLGNSTSALTEQTLSAQGQFENIPKFLVPLECADPLCVWRPTLLEEESAVLYLVRTWLRRGAVDLRVDALNALYLHLATVRGEQQRLPTAKQLVQDVALDVTLGVLSLLLANTNMAAHWWVVAMETCQQTGGNDVLQGLCRLLLPHGRWSLDLLQQQVIALRMVVIDNKAPSSPLPLSESRMKFQIPSVDAQLTANEDAVFCADVSCTVADCLGAFYCMAVLEKWLHDAQTKKESSNKEGPLQGKTAGSNGLTVKITSGATESQGEAVVSIGQTLELQSQSIEQQGDTVDLLDQTKISQGHNVGFQAQPPKDPEGEGRINGVTPDSKDDAEGHLFPAHEKLRCLCRAVLRDVQVKRNRLMTVLEEIERAANERHYAPLIDTLRADGEGSLKENVPPRLLSCSSLPILRTVSGEYLNMDDSKGDAPPVPQTPRGITKKWTIGASSEEEDEVCVMADPTSGDATAMVPGSGNAENCVSTGACRTRPRSVSEHIVSRDTDSPSVTISLAADEDSSKENASKCMESLVRVAGCVDQMYRERTEVSVRTLQADQAWASQQLYEMAAVVTSSPFPDPLQSAMLLLRFLNYSPDHDADDMRVAVLRWARHSSFLSSHTAMLDKHQTD